MDKPRDCGVVQICSRLSKYTKFSVYIWWPVQLKQETFAMNKQEAIKIFEDKKVRAIWDAGEEKWFFSIVDVVKALTDSTDAAAYWRKLKQRLKAEGNETVTNCHGLKMPAKTE